MHKYRFLIAAPLLLLAALLLVRPHRPKPHPTPLPTGFYSMCDRVTENVYTTVIVKDAYPSSILYAYHGPVDPTTGAPATAEGSQQWCKDHDPGRIHG